MTKKLFLAAFAASSLLLVGCPSTDFPTCSGPLAAIPGGSCRAYYYQTDYGSGGATTQALTDCEFDSQRLGGNVVAFHTLSRGIGLRWLDQNTLEVAVPSGVKLESQRSQDIYLGHRLTYKYRTLLPGDSVFAGCHPKRATGGT